MKKIIPITHLFLDIGGVLLTNGWDHTERKRAAAHFGFDFAEMDARHRLFYDLYEAGKSSLDDYLARVLFYEKRSFTRAQFKSFMLAQSQPYPEMLELMHEVKARYGLKVAVVSNEARELNAHRIRKFKLDRLVDTFISSCFVGVRKPDREIFRLALDIAQAKPEQTIYIENTPMFVEIAEELGIHAILHTDYASTRGKLASFGYKT